MEDFTAENLNSRKLFLCRPKGESWGMTKVLEEFASAVLLLNNPTKE